MVTWGTNETKTYDKGTTAAGAAASPGTPGGGLSFGSTSAPAPFGATPATSPFGSPAPFGATPAPAPFGSPAPSGGLFAAPASSGSIFGAPAPSSGGLFGSTNTTSSSPGGGFFGSSNTSGSLFGTPAPPPQSPFGPNANMVPAQAAFHAHQTAQAQQVEAEIHENLSRLVSAYRGQKAAPSSTQSAPFTTVLYNPASTEYQQYCWLVQGRTGNTAVKPMADRPAQISAKDWELACLRAPDGYEPASSIGAAALQARLMANQQQADKAMAEVKALRDIHKKLHERQQIAMRQGLHVMKDRLQKERKQRLWQIIQKVEMIRAYQFPLTKDERVAMEQTVQLHKATEKLASQHLPTDTAVHTGMPRLVTPDGLEPVDPQTVRKALESHRTELSQLLNAVKKDLRDVRLINERLKK